RASLITAIMSSDPAPISSMQPMTPPNLDRVVKTCLGKDPEERWQSAADVKRELQWLGEGSSAGSAVTVPRRRAPWLPWATAGLALLAATVVALRSARPSPAAARAERIQLSIVPPERMVLSDFFDLSPDGRTLAFVGTDGGNALFRTRARGSDAGCAMFR